MSCGASHTVGSPTVIELILYALIEPPGGNDIRVQCGQLHLQKNLMHMEDLVTQLRLILTEHGVLVHEALEIDSLIDLRPAPVWLPETEDVASIELHLLKGLFGSDATECMHLKTDEDARVLLTWSAMDSFTKAFNTCLLKMDSGTSSSAVRAQLQQEGLLGLQQLLHINPHQFIGLLAVCQYSQKKLHVEPSKQLYRQFVRCLTICDFMHA